MEKHYIGIDLASEVSVLTVVNGAGRTVLFSRIRTQEAAIRQAVSSVPKPRAVAFEEGTQAQWVFNILEKQGESVIVCRCESKDSGRRRSKGDDLDSHYLAEQLRLGALKPVWHGGGASRQNLMHLLQLYVSLTKDSTRLKNRLKALFRGEGKRVSAKVYDAKEREKLIAKMSFKEAKVRARSYGSQLDEITSARMDTLKRFVREARKNPIFKRIRCGIPQIGILSAAYFTAIVWTAERFSNRKKFISYCGFAVIEHDTCQYRVDKKTGGIKKKQKTFSYGLSDSGNPHLKWIFKRAAMRLERGVWKERFAELCANQTPENARLTLARKLATITLHIAKTGERYDEVKAFKAGN